MPESWHSVLGACVLSIVFGHLMNILQLVDFEHWRTKWVAEGTEDVYQRGELIPSSQAITSAYLTSILSVDFSRVTCPYPIYLIPSVPLKGVLWVRTSSKLSDWFPPRSLCLVFQYLWARHLTVAPRLCGVHPLCTRNYFCSSKIPGLCWLPDVVLLEAECVRSFAHALHAPSPFPPLDSDKQRPETFQ